MTRDYAVGKTPQLIPMLIRISEPYIKIGILLKRLLCAGGGTPVIARVPVMTIGKPFAFVAQAIKSNLDLKDSR